MRYIWNCILKVEIEVDNKQGKYKIARFRHIASTQKYSFVRLSSYSKAINSWCGCTSPPPGKPEAVGFGGLLLDSKGHFLCAFPCYAKFSFSTEGRRNSKDINFFSKQVLQVKKFFQKHSQKLLSFFLPLKFTKNEFLLDQT